MGVIGDASHRVLGCFDGTCLDNFSSRFGLEYGRLFSKGIDALALFCCWLFDDDKFCEARNKKGAILLQFLVTNSRKRLHDAFYVALLQLGTFRDLAD